MRLGCGLQEFCLRFSRKLSTSWHSKHRRWRMVAIRAFLKCTPKRGVLFRANLVSNCGETTELHACRKSADRQTAFCLYIVDKLAYYDCVLNFLTQLAVLTCWAYSTNVAVWSQPCNADFLTYVHTMYILIILVQVADGVTYHIIDVFLTELKKVSSNQVSRSINVNSNHGDWIYYIFYSYLMVWLSVC